MKCRASIVIAVLLSGCATPEITRTTVVTAITNVEATVLSR